MTYLKSLNCPRVSNFELLDGVDRVSRSIEGCNKLAESALGQTKMHQNPEDPNPQCDRMGDIFSGINRVDATLVDCINMAEDTLQQGNSKKRHMTAKPCGKTDKANPQLDRMGQPNSGTDQASSSKSSNTLFWSSVRSGL